MSDDAKTVDISVICLAYCHEKYIRKALDSILSQERNFSWEILITDDASTDSTASILKEYESVYPDMKVLYREKNVGATENVSYLFSIARGRYLAFLELDDYWTDDRKLSKQFSFLEEHPQYIGCAHSFSVVNQNNVVIKRSERLLEKSKNNVFSLRTFRTHGFLIHTCTVFCKNIFLNSTVPEIIKKVDRNRGDITINYLLLKKGSFFILPDDMATYRKILNPEENNVCSINMRDPEGSRFKQVLQCVTLIKELKPSFSLYCFLADSLLIWSGFALRNKCFSFSKIRQLLNIKLFPSFILLPYRFIIIVNRYMHRTKVE